MGQLITITCGSSGLTVGNFSRQLLTPSKNGCNEPYKDRFWCPKQKWFMKRQCAFIDRFECIYWEDQCYGKTY